MEVGLDGSCQTLCAPGDTPYPTYQCCPIGATLLPNGSCPGLPPPPPSKVCPTGEVEVDGKCVPAPKPAPLPPPICAPGYTLGDNGMCQRVSTTCPEKTGEVPGPNGSCVCPRGAQLGPDRACHCPDGNLANGHECGPYKPAPCPPDRQIPTGCCPAGSIAAPNGSCTTICSPGQMLEANGQCGPILTPLPPGGCPANEIPKPGGGCMPGLVPQSAPTPCLPGVAPGTNGCVQAPIGTSSPTVFAPKPPTKPPCQNDEERNADGACVPIHRPVCRDGEVLGPNGACEKPEPKKELPPKIEAPKTDAPKPPLPKLKLPVFRPSPLSPRKPNILFNLPSRNKEK